MAVCPICQHDSRNPAHCELCDAALSPDAALPERLALPDGDLDLSAFAGRWPIDFARPHLIPHAGRLLRVHALERGWFRDLKPALAERAALQLPVLPPIHFVLCGEGALVLAEAQAERLALPAHAETEDEWLHLERTVAACELIAEAMEALHDAGLVWLAFDPDALEQTEHGPRVTNLDLGVYRTGACPAGLHLSPAYSAPEASSFQRERIGPAADVFALAAYAYYRLARLPAGFPGDGLPAFDFATPPLRTSRPWMPAGIAPVIDRGLSRDPDARPNSPREFAQRLRQAVADAHARHDHAVEVAVEAAGASRPGRVHDLAGLPNQDRFAIIELPGGEAYIVADGVTHALIGTGDLASQTAVDTLVADLPRRMEGRDDLMTRAKGLAEAFEEASRAVLDQALAQPLGRLATDPTDLMSTTAVVAVRRGRELLLGCAGDSRAYLVRDGVAEQLTVDGDLGSLHLATGTPPERVREMGIAAQALYRCLGVSQPGPGRLVLDPERCEPDLTYWPLLPGDVIVLCTDGLVEEGTFLSPADLAGLIDDAPAATLVERLVAAALARHRGASESEPEGCGDDVTCIVVRVLPAGE
jgi:serine/threonine protein phosphatase PrpC